MSVCSLNITRWSCSKIERSTLFLVSPKIKEHLKNKKFGDLQVLLNKFERNPSENFLNANTRLEWSIELFDALAFMHERTVAHCDLKPKNVFLFTNKRKENQISLKIGDFGMSKEKSMSDLKMYVGTWHYQSPEVMRMQPFSFETDVW